jgi:hypothetical protein
MPAGVVTLLEALFVSILFALGLRMKTLDHRGLDDSGVVRRC